MLLILLSPLACLCDGYVTSINVYSEGDELLSANEVFEDYPVDFLWQGQEVQWDYEAELGGSLADLRIAGEAIPFEAPGLDFGGHGTVGFGEMGFYVGMYPDGGDDSEIFVWDGSTWTQSSVDWFNPLMVSRPEGEPLLWEFYLSDAGAGGPSNLIDLGTGETSTVTFAWDEPDQVNDIDAGADGTLFAQNGWEVATETCTSGVLAVDILCDVVPFEDGVLIWQIDGDQVIAQTMDPGCQLGAAEVELVMDGELYSNACDAVTGGAQMGEATFFEVSIFLEKKGDYEETLCE